MLTQNHVPIIKGFMGQTTGFHKDKIKKHIVIMGEDPASDQVKYLHGNFEKELLLFMVAMTLKIINILWEIPLPI